MQHPQQSLETLSEHPLCCSACGGVFPCQTWIRPLDVQVTEIVPGELIEQYCCLYQPVAPLSLGCLTRRTGKARENPVIFPLQFGSHGRPQAR